LQAVREPNWEVNLKIVIGKAPGFSGLGADGMAFWFTKEPGSIGPVFGNIDKWDGLGIMFDTWDNDRYVIEYKITEDDLLLGRQPLRLCRFQPRRYVF
jgi:hypothetical protein